jgi:hypothetical protein
MNEKKLIKLLHERSRSLREKRHQVLSKTPEKALSDILDAKNPVELIHSFPEEDFYFLVHGIGPEDALPLLAMASGKQLDYLLDIDLWHRDRFDHHAAVQWLNVLMKAEPERLTRWLSSEKIDFLEFFLFKNIEVKIREQDQEPSEISKAYMTFDEVYYFRFLESFHDDAIQDDAPGTPENQDNLKEREQFMTDLLQHLAERDHARYIQILMESATVIPAESEEEMYRQRNVRLAEKGFLPFEESIGIYQPLKPEDMDRSRQKAFVKPKEPESPPLVPFFPNLMMESGSSFAKALGSIQDEHMVMQLQAEFASLCNRLIVADRKGDITKESLREIVGKACGFISIGLDNLSGGKQTWIRKYPLADLFRVGYGFALDLKWRAEKWRKKSWFAAEGLPLSFWGEEWLGVVGGLLLKNPLYFDNYQTGVLYRDFSTVQDIVETESVLNQVMAFDTLLAHVPVKLKPLHGYTLLTYKNLILTLWARHYTGLDTDVPRFSTLSLDSFRSFFQELWEPERKPRTVGLAMKQNFLTWLARTSGLSGAEITERSGHTLETLFHEIENEYADVADHGLDPRFIPHFLLRK